MRRFPGSGRQPQFGGNPLKEALRSEGVAYRHFSDLGGRRGRSRKDSPNGGGRGDAFQVYADYMLTADFQAALDEREEAATSRRAAMMCAEAVPWRCHRRLIADALTVRGWSEWDIFSVSRSEQHDLTSFACWEGGQLRYPVAEKGEARYLHLQNGGRSRSQFFLILC